MKSLKHLNRNGGWIAGSFKILIKAILNCPLEFVPTAVHVLFFTVNWLYFSPARPYVFSVLLPLAVSPSSSLLPFLSLPFWVLGIEYRKYWATSPRSPQPWQYWGLGWFWTFDPPASASQSVGIILYVLSCPAPDLFKNFILRRSQGKAVCQRPGGCLPGTD